MDLSKLRYCFLWVAFCFVLQCSDKSSNPDTAKHYSFDQEIAIDAGESVVIGSDELRLTFEQVNFDDRCAAPTTCAKSDFAEIRLRMMVTGGSDNYIDVGIRSASSAESLEILRVDTLGYSITLTNLIPSVDSLQIGEASGDYVATILVSKTHSRKRFNGFLIQREPAQGELDNSLTYQVISAQTAGDTLAMVVQFNQGCRAHYFDLFFDPEMVTNDTIVGVNMWLRQTAGADSCTKHSVSRTLRVDISSIRSSYTQQFGDWECVRLVLQPAGASAQLGQPTEVIYGRCRVSSHPPELELPASYLIKALWTTSIEIRATDADRDPIGLYAHDLPANSQFIDNFDGTGTFRMTPTIFQRGIHRVKFFAFDGRFIDSEAVSIVVARPDTSLDAPPTIGEVAEQYTYEGGQLTAVIAAHDVDGDSLTFFPISLPTNSKLRDHHNNTANFDIAPDYFQSGIQVALIGVSDGYRSDTGMITVHVENINRKPYFTKLDYGLVVKQNSEMSTEIEVRDADNEAVVLEYGQIPAHVTISNIAVNRYRLDFQPDTTQFGLYQIPLTISDGIDTVVSEIAIQVVDGYSAIYFDPVDSITVTEGEKLTVEVHAYSPQLGINSILISNLDTLKSVSFSNLGNGVGRLTISPSFVSAGAYRIRVTARDRLEEKSIDINVNVLEAGDQPPKFDRNLLHFALYYSDSLSICITAVDPDRDASEIAALQLPEGAWLEQSPSCARFHFAAHHVVGKVYVALFEAFDPDVPEAKDTLELQIAVHSVQENDGPYLPGGIGNYWVYEYTTGEGYNRGSYGTGESYARYTSTIDSIEVIDSTIVDGKVWWVLSKRLWTFGDTFTNDGDTTKFYTGAPYRYRAFFPQGALGRAIVFAGAFSKCYSQHNPNWWEPTYSHTFAAGIGVLHASYNSLSQSPMACEHGCGWSLSSISLLRYRLR